MLKLLGENVPIGVVSYVKGSATSIERDTGLRSILDAKTKLYDTIYCGGNADKAYNLTKELLIKYPNLYADLSAGSGFNAISRDYEYGIKFLEEFQNKLVFGTDICRHGQEAPIANYIKTLLKEGRISQSAYDKITHLNAERLLKL